MLKILSIVCLAVVSVFISHPAAAYYHISGSFTASAACPGVINLRHDANPDAVMVEPGKSYVVRGLNKKGGSYVDLVIPGAADGARWVRLDCGVLSTTSAPPVSAPPVSGNAPFQPFFDVKDDGRADPTPPPPVLNAFDRAVLDVCGPWGSKPTMADFRQILDRQEFADDIAYIYQTLDRSVNGDGQETLPEFKGRLTQLWFRSEGFVHIFCGEPGSSALGGFHFAGRYLQAQEQGWAGLAPEAKCSKASREIAPPIYTLGVEYLTLDGKRKADCLKGYPYGMDARTMLVEATLAMKSMKGETGKKMCLKKLKMSGQDYYAVSVIKNMGVRTFYPDASPSCNGGAAASACLCGM